MLSKFTIRILQQTVKFGNLVHFFPFWWNPKKQKFELLSKKSKILEGLCHLTTSFQCILHIICLGLCATHYYYTEFELGNTILSIFMALLHVGQVAYHTQYRIFAVEHVFHLNYLIALNNEFGKFCSIL